MRRTLRYFQLPSLAAMLSLLLSCTPTAAAPKATQVPDIGLTLADGWQPVTPGLEYQAFTPGVSYPFTQLVALRLDAAAYEFRVHYQPQAPLRLAGWRALLPDAALIINASFFTPEGQALGLLIVDGVLYHPSFIDYGGTFAIDNNASDGAPSVRSNILFPYAGEAYTYAVQGFPMLITNGTAAYVTGRRDRPSRRTVIAQDDAGRIVVITTPSLFGMRLADLSSYLESLDLGLVNAVNLDGGGSVMFSLAVPELTLDYTSIDPVPVVIAAYPVGG